MEEPTLTTVPTKREMPLYLKGVVIFAKILGYLFVVFLGGFLIGSLLIQLLVSPDIEAMMTGDLTDWQANSLMFGGMAIASLLTTWLFRTKIDRGAIETIGLSGGGIVAQTLKGGGWAMAILTLAYIILYAIGAIKGSMGDFSAYELLGFLLLFLIVSINEELIFRGYITSLIAKDFHFMGALIVGALIFAAVHIGNIDFTWWGFSSIFLGGYIMGLLFLKNQDLYTPIGMHWFWNYYHGNVLGFDVSGHDVPSLLQLEMLKADWITGGEFGLEGSVVTIILLFLASIGMTYKWYDDLQLAMDKTKNLSNPADAVAQLDTDEGL